MSVAVTEELVFLSKTEVAERLGMKSVRSLNKVKLPPHDARIGNTPGWKPITIDVWHAERWRDRWGYVAKGPGWQPEPVKAEPQKV